MFHFRKGDLKNIFIVIGFTVLLLFVVFNMEALWGAFLKLISFMSPIFTGLAIAYVLNILMRIFEEKIFAFMKRSKRKFIRKLLRPIALLLTIAVFLGVITVLIAVVWPDLEDTIVSLFAQLPSYFNDLKAWGIETLTAFHFDTQWLEEFTIDWKAISNAVVSFFDVDFTSSVIGGAASIAGSLTSGVMNLIFSFIIAVYFLAQKERIGAFSSRLFRAFLPTKLCNWLFHVANISDSIFSNFLRGQCTEALIFGFLCYIGMLIFQFPYAGIISIVIGITALVPIVGALVGEAFGVILILTVSPIRAIFFLIFILVLQQLEGSLIYPKVVGTSIGMPGILVFSAVIIGGNIGGILNTFLSVPVCAVLYTLLREEMTKRAAKKAALEASSEEEAPPDISASDT